MKNYTVKNVGGHYEIYVGGKFHASCDTWSEVRSELQKLEEETVCD